MQHNVVVAWILIMAMLVPVRGTVVNLNVAHPKCFTNLYLRIEEIGSGVVIVQTRIDDLDGTPVGGRQLAQRQQFMFPSIVEQYFHSYPSNFCICLSVASGSSFLK